MSESSKIDWVSDDELRGLFERERPDPHGFEARVRVRIAEREARDDDAHAQHDEPSAFVRWAASVLPPDVGVALLAKKAGFLTTLGLPALIVASSFGAFFAGQRSIARSARDAAPPTAREPRWNEQLALRHRDLRAGERWLIVLSWASLVPLFAPLLFRGHALDVTIGVLLGAMGVLTLSVRGLARAGLMRRGTVAGMCCGVLITIYGVCFLWNTGFGAVDTASRLGGGVRSAVFLLGIAGCALVMLHERSACKTRVAFVIGWCVFVHALLAPPFVSARHEQLVDCLESFDADVGTPRGWNDAGHAGMTLRAIGEPLPSLEHVRRAVEHAIDDDADAHPAIWTNAARLGLIDDAHWARLSRQRLEPHKLDQLLAQSGPLRVGDDEEYELWMLLATRTLGEAQREQVSARVEASWPRDDERRALDAAHVCVRWWSLLGRLDRIAAHRDDVRALLARHWVSGEHVKWFGKVGGFTSDPDDSPTSRALPTWVAVDLMTRVGVPASIDLALLRGHLRTQAELGFAQILKPALVVDCVAALLRLEREIGLPPRTWLEAVVGERALIATLLMLLLCFVAIRSAAPSSALATATLDS